MENTAEAEAARIAELKARTHRLGGEIDGLKGDQLDLKRQIYELEAIRSEVKYELDFAAAQKEQLSKEVEELKKRWNWEFEGLIDHDDAPVLEVFQKVAREINKLRKENRELKRQLEEAKK